MFSLQSLLLLFLFLLSTILVITPSLACQQCTEKYIPGSRYQAYSDGFCNKNNLCGGSNSQCICQARNYRKNKSDYIFEQTSDYQSASAYYPYNLPSQSLGRFENGPNTVSYNMVNYTNNDYIYATHAFTLNDYTLEGKINLVHDVPLLPRGTGIFSEIKFGFRVRRTGNYVIRANFQNVVHNYLGFSFEIDDRDYHPERSNSRVANWRVNHQSDEKQTIVRLEVGHSYLLDLLSYISGEASSTTLG
eukprot:Pgem_evm1s384